MVGIQKMFLDWFRNQFGWLLLIVKAVNLILFKNGEKGMGTRRWKKAINLEKMFAFTILKWILQLSDGLVTLRNEGHKFGQVSKINRVVFSAPASPGSLAAGLESEQLQRHLHWEVTVQFSSGAQLCPTLQSHGLQHTRPSCPLPAPRVHSNSCPLSQWCHPTI